MGKTLDCIGDEESEFIAQQKVFFVATAPLNQEQHVNVSPKAPGTSVVVIDPHTVAYADLSGSGAETAAHVLENQRLTLLFCNLEKGPPKILRLYGKARVVIDQDVEPVLLANFPKKVTSSCGFRAIYILKVERISTSCGYSLPVMQFERYREILNEFTDKQGSKGMKDYGLLKNSFSIDGLPSLGLLRNREKDDCIIPNSKEGYVFGERVSSKDPRYTKEDYFTSSNSSRGVASKNQEGLGKFNLLIFLLGALFGVFVTVGLQLIPSEDVAREL